MKRVVRFSFFFLWMHVAVTTIGQSIQYDNNKSAGHYIPVNGIKLYYEEYGKGIPLLMLHGNGGDISAFREQIPFFSKHFRVIAIDSRLQGKSGGSADTLSYNMMAEDFCAFVNTLKLDSVYVLGWSDGGINAILMALKCSTKVKKIAFTGANTLPDSTAISAADIQSMKDFVENNKTATAREKTLTRMMINEPVIPFSTLGTILCPALVMAGDHDIIKAEHTLKIYQSILGAKLCIFPDSNHGVCQQHPALFNKIVFEFFMNINAR